MRATRLPQSGTRDLSNLGTSKLTHVSKTLCIQITFHLIKCQLHWQPNQRSVAAITKREFNSYCSKHSNICCYWFSLFNFRVIFLLGFIKCNFSFIADRLRHLSPRKSNIERYLFVGKSIAFACDSLQSVKFHLVLHSNCVHLAILSFAQKRTFRKLTGKKKLADFPKRKLKSRNFLYIKRLLQWQYTHCGEFASIFLIVEVSTHINEISFPIDQLCATRFHFVEFTVSVQFRCRFAYGSSFLFTWMHIRHVIFSVCV